MMRAASPPLTRRAIVMTMAATHKRDAGGSANITTANTTSATNTPVRRIGLLPVGAVFAAKVASQEDQERRHKVGNQVVKHHFPILSSRIDITLLKVSFRHFCISIRHRTLQYPLGCITRRIPQALHVRIILATEVPVRNQPFLDRS